MKKKYMSGYFNSSTDKFITDVVIIVWKSKKIEPIKLTLCTSQCEEEFNNM